MTRVPFETDKRQRQEQEVIYDSNDCSRSMQGLRILHGVVDVLCEPLMAWAAGLTANGPVANGPITAGSMAAGPTAARLAVRLFGR